MNECQTNVYLELDKLASEVFKTKNIIVSINAFLRRCQNSQMIKEILSQQ